MFDLGMEMDRQSGYSFCTISLKLKKRMKISFGLKLNISLSNKKLNR